MAAAVDDAFSPEQILQALGHAVIVTGLDGIVRYWNTAAERLYGWPSQEACGRNIATLTVPRVTQTLAEEIMKTLRAGSQWSGGFTVQRKDGATFPALVTDTGVRSADGRLVGVCGVSIDLGHALRPLLTHSQLAALVLTEDVKITYVTPTAAQLIGWRHASLIGTSMWDLIAEEDRPAAREHHRKVITSGQPVPAVECRLRRADDSEVWVDLLLTNYLSDPVIRGLVCNLRDITERRASRNQLVTLTEQLQTALTSRVVIEQAKGLIAGQHGVDVDVAFGALRRYARDHNAKLDMVAKAVLDGRLRVPV